MKYDQSPDTPPKAFWLLPAIAGLLRTLPFLWIQWSNPPGGMAYLKLGYIPKDFLSYLAFIRQVGDANRWVFVNPFTTSPQSGRFILLFHWLLGLASSMVGHSEWVLELSRLPLLFLFFWVLWRFLCPILTARRERIWACVLIAFSGGLESFLIPLVKHMPTTIAEAFAQDTWHLVGWNTFESFFNPLWIAALTSMLVTVAPALKPDGPRDWRDFFQIGTGFFVTYLIHPYTAIFIIALLVFSPLVEFVLEGETSVRKHRAIAASVFLPGLILVALGYWQSQDSIYRLSASGIFGPQSLSVFWYPITLGLVGLAALRGIKVLFEEHRPYRLALVSWIVTVIFLHTSPILNGYKFAFLLHLPLCVLAAPVICALIQSRLLVKNRVGIACWLVMIGMFGQVLLVTVTSMADARTGQVIPMDYAKITAVLSNKPAGHVLAPPELGNILPAFTPHRVWVGHWFLTPNFGEKAKFYYALFQQPQASSLLVTLVEQQRIRYLVVPSSHLDSVDTQFGFRVTQRQVFEKWALLTIGDG